MSGSSFAWFAHNRLIPGPPVFTTRISRSIMSASLREKDAPWVYVMHKMEVSFWRFDWPAFLRALGNRPDKSPQCQPGRSRTQRAFLKPRSTTPSSVNLTPAPLRSASISETPAQCEWHPTGCKLIGLAASNESFVTVARIQYGLMREKDFFS